MMLVDNTYYSGPDPTDSIQNGGSAMLSGLTVGGSADFSDLNSSGTATIDNLIVTGSATINNLTVTGSTTLGSLNVNGNAQFGESLSIGDSQNGFSYTANVAPSTTTPLFNGTSRPIKSISEVPEYYGLTTSNNPNGTLTTGFNTTPGAFHSYYNWTTSQATPQSESLYVRIPVPTDFSGFTPNDQICYYVYTDDTTPSDSKIATIFYDTNDNPQATFYATPTVTNTWQQQCTNDIGGAVTVNGDTYITVMINLTADQNKNVRIAEFSFDYLSAF